MRALILALALAVGGCASSPVDRPCGVIVDSLGSVRAADEAGQRRINTHFERGVAAGCWTREAARS